MTTDKTPFQTEIDTLTRAVTSFASYQELANACARGFVPTLLSGIRQDALTVILEADGFRVSRGAVESEVERARRLT